MKDECSRKGDDGSMPPRFKGILYSGPSRQAAASRHVRNGGAPTGKNTDTAQTKKKGGDAGTPVTLRQMGAGGLQMLRTLEALKP